MSTLNDADATAALMALVARRTSVGVGARDAEGSVAVFSGVLGVLGSEPSHVILGVVHHLDADPALIVVPTDADVTIAEHHVTFDFSGMRVVIDDLEHATATPGLES